MTLCRLLLASLLSIASLGAQETRGTIVGRITDTSGAVVVGANIEALNLAMGTRVEITSNADGYYLFLC